MKIGIFSPYLDTLGGGERYMMAIAQTLGKKGNQVDVFWDDPEIKQKLKKHFDFDLENVQIRKYNLFAIKNLLNKWRLTGDYDCFFFLSDGSLPFLFAKKNFVVFCVPFAGKKGRSLINRIKIRNLSIISISKFTKKSIDPEYSVNSKIIYPPVAVDDFRAGEKQNIILSVSRFSQTLHAKKQGVLIEAFADLYRQGLRGWRMILAGGSMITDRYYLKQLKASAGGLPVKFLTNISYEELRNIYGQSKIFWHAAGFGENENTHPERVEHFGIVVVEAMAAGCVPVVIGKGGIPEIINDRKSGFLWQGKKDLEKLTLQLIKSPDKMAEISKQAIIDCQKFNEKNFNNKIYELVK
jgi:glycosyltransferase involved in cell wall biosynthesis